MHDGHYAVSLAGAYIFKINVRDHLARQVALAFNPEHLILKLHQAATVVAQFPQPPRPVQKIQMLQARKRRFLPRHPVTRFKQRLVEALAVVGHQHFKRL